MQDSRLTKFLALQGFRNQKPCPSNWHSVCWIAKQSCTKECGRYHQQRHLGWIRGQILAQDAEGFVVFTQVKSSKPRKGEVEMIASAIAKILRLYREQLPLKTTSMLGRPRFRELLDSSQRRVLVRSAGGVANCPCNRSSGGKFRG